MLHFPGDNELTHWGRVTHICISKLTIIGSDNGLSPGRRQAIIWTNAGILLIRTLGTNFSEILSEIHAFSFKKMHFKWSSGKWRPFCPGQWVKHRTILVLHWGKFRKSIFYISWWRHDMKMYSASLVLCEGNSPGDSPPKRPVTPALCFLWF